MTDPQESLDREDVHPWEHHCARIALLLLAGDIQARVVHVGGSIAGVEVRAQGYRIIWGLPTHYEPPNPLVWGWTMIQPDGSVEAAQSAVLAVAEVEDVAKAIATTMGLIDLPAL